MSENPESGVPSGKAANAVSAPPCLRVSLKGAGHRIGVDLFHVKMPHLFGALAVNLSKIDAFQAFAEAAPDSTPALPRTEENGTKTAGVGSSVAHSDRSVPQVSSNSLIQICPELQEMTLLVDASTPLLDVEQAHLSFVRLGDEFNCSMPSLRRIVRPTDWGTVRSDLREFALTAGNMQSAAQQKDVLKMKLRFQDDAKRCVEARDVQVSAFSPPASACGSEPMLRKLCLQIGGLKVVGKPKLRCELQGVHEGQLSKAILQLGSGPTWMSQVPSTHCEDDEISLAVSFQGLSISVVGPASKALDFVRKLAPDQPASSSQPASSASLHSSPHQPSSRPSYPPCPDSVLSLASRLSAASILSPEERVRRAWLCGQYARAQIESRPEPEEQVVSIDLPAKYWVVLRGRDYPEPKTLRNPIEFKKVFTGRGPPFEVGHEFPSETEARAYLTAAGYGHFAGI
eukprot:s4315_g4.t1